jgi:hypothetical protein
MWFRAYSFALVAISIDNASGNKRLKKNISRLMMLGHYRAVILIVLGLNELKVISD